MVRITGFRLDRKFLFILAMSWIMIVVLCCYYNDISLQKSFRSLRAKPMKVLRQFMMEYQPTPTRTLEKMKPMELYAHYMKLATEPTTTCEHRVRFGNEGDGGWEVCQDEPYVVEAPCLVYSMGINWDFSFDDAISGGAGCHVHSFDPSMKTESFDRSSLISFHAYGLKGDEVDRGKQLVDQTNFTLKNFDQILTSLNHREKTIDYFKMDIEGPEWRSLDLMLSRNLMTHVKQFAVEIHIFKWEFNKKMFLNSINVLERIRAAGFEIYMSHENPFGYYINPVLGRNISCCYEVYYLNTKYRKGS